MTPKHSEDACGIDVPLVENAMDNSDALREYRRREHSNWSGGGFSAADFLDAIQYLREDEQLSAALAHLDSPRARTDRWTAADTAAVEVLVRTIHRFYGEVRS